MMNPRVQQQGPSRVLSAGLFLAAAALLTGTASAQDPVGQWQLRFYAAAVDMEHGSAGPPRPVGAVASYDTNAGGGLGVNAEYRFSKRLGLDLGLFSGGDVAIEAHVDRPDGGSSWATYDTLSFTPLTVGLDIHLTPGRRVDLYASPMAALIRYGSLTARFGPTGHANRIEFDEAFGLGARLGLGAPLGSGRWSFQANITYFDSSLEGRGADGVRFDSGSDSTLIGFGFGYRLARPRG